MELTRTSSYKVWESRERSLLFARWSYAATNRALLFVHGLCSNWDVWRSFRQTIEDPLLCETDVFFFDYRSLGISIARAGRDFREALNCVMSPSSDVFSHRSFPRERTAPFYRRVDIVAHSLGAVVTRTALDELANEQGGVADLSAPPDWQIEQLLLAPAHLGSKLPWLLKYIGTESMVAAVQFIRNGGVSAVMDLKEGSDLLKSLEAQVKDRLRSLPVAANSCGLRVEQTAHGYSDPVVVQRVYGLDANYALVEGDHFSIVSEPGHAATAFARGTTRE